MDRVYPVKRNRPFFILFTLSILTLFLQPLFIPVGGKTFPLFIGEIFIWLVFGFTFLVFLRERVRLKINGITLLLLMFTYVSCFSLIHVINFGRFAIGLLTYLEMILVLFLSYNAKLKESQIKSLIIAYCISGAVLATFIFIKIIIEYNFSFIIGHKIMLDIGASNYLASILLISSFITYTVITNLKFSRLFLVLLGVFGMVNAAIIFTGSRTALILMLGFYALFFFKDIFSKGANRKLLFPTLIVAITFIVLIGKKFIMGMIETGRFTNLLKQPNLLDRFSIYKHYFEAFATNPILGNGFMNVGMEGRENIWAHNFILQVLADSGLIAFFIFVILFISIFRFIHITINQADDNMFHSFMKGFSRALVVVLFHGLLEPNFGTKLFSLYFVLGLSIVIFIYNLQKEKPIV